MEAILINGAIVILLVGLLYRSTNKAIEGKVNKETYDLQMTVIHDDIKEMKEGLSDISTAINHINILLAKMNGSRDPKEDPQ